MEKVDMRQERLNGISIFRWKGVPLIQIGIETYVTAEPIGRNIRKLDIAERMAYSFSGKYKCKATVTNDLEWKELTYLLKLNHVNENFVNMNELNICEALLSNSEDGKVRHVLAGGQHHEIDEIFNGFISDYDANGEVQPVKLAFFTVKP